jgi:hypothetical protein
MVLVSIGAVVTAACSQVHADDFQISFAARAWYPVRKPDGHYDLHQITAAFGRPLVAMRSAVASLFQGDADAVYFAGYDAIKAPAHNTAWIVRASLSATLGPSR